MLTDCVHRYSGKHNRVSLRDAYMQHVSLNNYDRPFQAVASWNLQRLAYYFGAEWDRVCAQSWNDDPSYPYNVYIMTSGYQPYVTYLQTGIDIQYNTCAHRVLCAEDGVHVITNRGTYSGSYIIVTVSLGVLRSGFLTFEPELPYRKIQAMQAIGFGHLEKVILTFDQSFWPENAVRFATESYDMVSHFVSMQAYINRPILIGFIPGTAAYAFTQWSFQVQRTQIMKSLRNVFGVTVPEPRDISCTSWCTHPGAYGAFSYVAVGSDENNIHILAEPVPPVFFAGEATHPKQYSTVQGAYLSGRRVAHEVMQVATQ